MWCLRLLPSSSFVRRGIVFVVFFSIFTFISHNSKLSIRYTCNIHSFNKTTTKFYIPHTVYRCVDVVKFYINALCSHDLTHAKFHTVIYAMRLNVCLEYCWIALILIRMTIALSYIWAVFQYCSYLYAL